MGLNVQVSSGLIEFRNPVEFTYDLYSPASMSLAWRVHLWACDGYKYLHWWKEEHPWTFDDAQRRWLDKILSLAIEAGIVEVDDACNSDA